MPQMIETKVSAAKKDITSHVWNNLEVLKKCLHGIENWVQDRFHVHSYMENDELKVRLADMHYHIVNLAKQPVQSPPSALPKSLMQMLNKAPPVQSLDGIWGEELPTKSKNESIRFGISTRTLLYTNCLRNRKQRKELAKNPRG